VGVMPIVFLWFEKHSINRRLHTVSALTPIVARAECRSAECPLPRHGEFEAPHLRGQLTALHARRAALRCARHKCRKWAGIGRASCSVYRQRCTASRYVSRRICSRIARRFGSKPDERLHFVSCHAATPNRPFADCVKTAPLGARPSSRPSSAIRIWFKLA
jgi:hypothetical protein